MKKLRTPTAIVNKIIGLCSVGMSARQVSKAVFGTKSKKSTVNDIYRAWRDGEVTTDIDFKQGIKEFSEKEHLPRVLVLDIETAPLKVGIFSIWQHGVPLSNIDSDWFILSMSAMWLGDKEEDIIYADMRGKVASEDDSHILDRLWLLLDEADVLLTHNGRRFDLKKIKSRMVLQGYKPFSPVKHIDTLDIVKREFGFTSNKLEYLTGKLCTKYVKSGHGKFPSYYLWKGMMEDNIEAFEECHKYNNLDILSLAEMYYILAPWDTKHVNFNLFTEEEEHTCRCGSHNVVPDGFAYTGVSKFQRYRCQDCGATTRGRKNLFTKEKMSSLQMNIA